MSQERNCEATSPDARQWDSDDQIVRSQARNDSVDHCGRVGFIEPRERFARSGNLAGAGLVDGKSVQLDSTAHRKKLHQTGVELISGFCPPPTLTHSRPIVPLRTGFFSTALRMDSEQAASDAAHHIFIGTQNVRRCLVFCRHPLFNAYRVRRDPSFPPKPCSEQVSEPPGQFSLRLDV